MIAYRVKPSYKGNIIAAKPTWRHSGRFVTTKLTQKEMKYLHDVIKHPAIESYEKTQPQPEQSKE